MTKRVSDYFAHRMEDPSYASAHRDLEAEYRVERKRIQEKIAVGSLKQKFKEVSEYFEAHPHLMRVLDWLQEIERQQALLIHIVPAGQLTGASADYQISSEANYDVNFISTEVSYNVEIS